MTVHQLGPEEVGARVSAILEAAERDARAVIAAAYREAAPPAAPATLEELAEALQALSRRVDAIERTISASPQTERARAEDQPARPPREDAVRVRAIELSLAGHSRAAIAHELAGTMAPADVDRLLDEVLAG
jgi:hypothetical protein